MIDRIIFILGCIILSILLTLGLIDYQQIYNMIINITSIVAFIIALYTLSGINKICWRFHVSTNVALDDEEL